LRRRRRQHCRSGYSPISAFRRRSTRTPTSPTSIPSATGSSWRSSRPT